MEITKDLKEKLLKAKSKEEVKTLLGEGTTDEQAAHLWEETQAHCAVLEEVDDGELDAVNGGFKFTDIFTRPFAGPDRDYNTDGCAATVENGSWCASNDACYNYDVKYTNNEDACVIGVKGHDWGDPWREEVDRGYYRTRKTCKRCGKVVSA